VRGVLDPLGLTPADVDLFAVAAGPGSFTGLRIGMATAKGLAFASGRPLVAYSTLETMALALEDTMPAGAGHVICVMLDAGRGEVYRGLFRCAGGAAAALLPEAALPPHAAAAEIPEGCLLCGDGFDVHREALGPLRASGMAIHEKPPFIGLMLARRALADAALRGLGHLPPPVPNYLRLADAEMTILKT
jgi:tRNA threonylcarbamoyladenosine biosynthesis protein TsaB